jgi:hypothetical protein
LTLLAQVCRYLRTYKFERACLLPEEYQRVTPRNGRYTTEQRAARAQLEERFFAISVRAGSSGRVASASFTASSGGAMQNIMKTSPRHM